MSKTSPPVLVAPHIPHGRQNLDINDLGDITASQELSLFSAAFDSETPKRDTAEVCVTRGEQLGDQILQISRAQPHMCFHQAGQDKSLFMGHTLRPLQRGLRVAVIGDGWGQGLGKSGYEAIITEADDLTYTVVTLGGHQPWIETHVLKQYCVLLDRQISSSTLGGLSPSSLKRRAASSHKSSRAAKRRWHSRP